jgi:hypothetical protein
VVWLFPNNATFPNDRVWVTTPTRNYTTADMHALLLDAGLSETEAVFGAVEPFPSGVAPGVEVHCSYGYDVPTDNTYAFASLPSDADPVTAAASGDGVVLLESLAVCGAWAQQQTQPVHVHTYEGMFHAAETYRADTMADLLKACVTA